jgi:hypothetical protein
MAIFLGLFLGLKKGGSKVYFILKNINHIFFLAKNGPFFSENSSLFQKIS